MNSGAEGKTAVKGIGTYERTKKSIRTLLSIGVIALSGAACGSAQPKGSAKPLGKHTLAKSGGHAPKPASISTGAALPSIYKPVCDLLPASSLPVNTAGNGGLSCDEMDVSSTYSGNYAYVGDQAPLTVVTVSPDPGNTKWRQKLGLDKPGPSVNGYPTLVDSLGDLTTEVGQYNVSALYAETSDHSVRIVNNAKILSAIIQAASH